MDDVYICSQFAVPRLNFYSKDLTSLEVTTFKKQTRNHNKERKPPKIPEKGYSSYMQTYK